MQQGTAPLCILDPDKQKTLQRAVNLNPLVGSFIRTEFQSESQFYLLLESSLSDGISNKSLLPTLLGYFFKKEGDSLVITKEALKPLKILE
jgi:hypothetical protein